MKGIVMRNTKVIARDYAAGYADGSRAYQLPLWIMMAGLFVLIVLHTWVSSFGWYCR